MKGRAVRPARRWVLERCRGGDSHRDGGTGTAAPAASLQGAPRAAGALGWERNVLAPHPLPPRWPMKPPLRSRFPFGDRAQSEGSGGCPAPHRALPAVLFPIPVPCHSPATSCMLVVPRTEQTLRPPSQMRGEDVAEGVLSQAPGQARGNDPGATPSGVRDPQPTLPCLALASTTAWPLPRGAAGQDRGLGDRCRLLPAPPPSAFGQSVGAGAAGTGWTKTRGGGHIPSVPSVPSIPQPRGGSRAGASPRGPRLPPWRGGEARAGDVVAAGPRPRARGHREVPEGWAGGQPAAAFVCTPIINASPLRFANNSRLSLSGDKWAPLKFSFLKSKAKKHFHNPASPPCPSQGLWCSQGGTAALLADSHPPGTAQHPPVLCHAHSPATCPLPSPGVPGAGTPLFGAQGLPTASPGLELEVGAASEHPRGSGDPRWHGWVRT